MRLIIAFIFAAFLAGTVLAQDQTQSLPPQPQDPPQGWYQQSSGGHGGLAHVFFENQDSGWASAGSSFSIFTTNGGSNWQVYSDSIAVLGFIGNFGYGNIIKGQGWMAFTTDNGLSWNSYNTGFDVMANLHFCTPNRGFCFETTNGQQFIASTINGGKTWTVYPSDLGQIAAFACFDSTHTIAGGSNYFPPSSSNPEAGIFYTSDGGASWKFTMKFPIVNAELEPFAAFDTATVYFIGGPQPGVYKSSKWGYLMQPFNFPDGGFMPYQIGGAFASDPNNITIVGGSGQIFRSYDGVNFTKQNSGTTQDLYSVSFADSSIGWAVGNATILHTSNAGYSWVKQQITLDTLNTQSYPNPADAQATIG